MAIKAVEVHHILKKQFVKKKGKYPEWIHSGLNLVKLTGIEHDQIHAPSTNEKAKAYKESVFKDIWNGVLLVNEMHSLFDATEMEAIYEVYAYCTIHSWKKENKPCMDTMKVYELCCKKYQDYLG